MSVRLKRLKVHTFRDLAPGTELHFSDGWNVVLGRNATGKTTLLHLISMALRGDFSELKGEPVSLEYDVAFGAWEVFVALRSVQPMADVGEAGSLRHRPPTEIAVEPLSIVVQRGDLRFAFGSPHQSFGDAVREPLPSARDPLLLTRRLLASFADALPVEMASEAVKELFVDASFRFDEALELFHVIHERSPVGASLPAPMAPLVVAGTVLTNLFPTKARAEVSRTFDAVRMTFDQCPNLHSIHSLLDSREFTARWPVEDVRGNATTLGAPTILLHRADGSATSVQRLSFGQRRLFAFAWYLDSNPGAVVADELVNGMHYEWIEWCVEALKGRQVFVTAQNPLLLDHLTFREVDDVRRGFVLCRAAREGDTRVVRWTHPSEAQSAEFLRAYENGVLRVHEILRTEGLW